MPDSENPKDRPERGERSTAFSETKPPQKVTLPPPDERGERAAPTDGSEGGGSFYTDKPERKGS